MSYWVSGYVRNEEVFAYNYTSNVSMLFRAAFAIPYNRPESGGIRDLDGIRCSKAVSILALVLTFMYNPENASTFKALNPTNKWGDFETARAFLQRILNGCLAYPQARLRVV
jgi:hypothetical protein